MFLCRVYIVISSSWAPTHLYKFLVQLLICAGGKGVIILVGSCPSE